MRILNLHDIRNSNTKFQPNLLRNTNLCNLEAQGGRGRGGGESGGGGGRGEKDEKGGEDP